FQESLQKALRGLETGLSGLNEIDIPGLGQGDDKNAVKAALGTPTAMSLPRQVKALPDSATTKRTGSSVSRRMSTSGVRGDSGQRTAPISASSAPYQAAA
ncbi:hypothetical protein J8J40_23330, partial [Mycobacterium tuberculosis]|nr:hypothetical protein [Mycobacterium tuberculosis]